MKALNLSATRPHVYSDDPDKGTPQATVFTLGAIDARVMSHLRDKSTNVQYDPVAGGAPIISVKSQEVQFEIVCYGLKNIKNLLDENDKPIDFKTQKRNTAGKSYTIADPDLVSLLPLDVIAELADEIEKFNSLSEQDTKNSETQSSQE